MQIPIFDIRIFALSAFFAVITVAYDIEISLQSRRDVDIGDPPGVGGYLFLFQITTLFILLRYPARGRFFNKDIKPLLRVRVKAVIQLVSTGEKTGRLAETLNRAASSYEEEFNRKMANTVSLFEPVMILLMGFVVCFIVLAVLLPIFQLNQLVK